MAYSKITHNGQVLIDLTNDTITQNVLRPGYTAHDASGTIVEGSYVPSVTQDEDGYLVLDEDGDAPDFFDMSKPEGAMYTENATLSAYVCCYRTGIVSVIAPNVTSIGTYAFNRCSKLKSCYFPMATTVSAYSFSYTALVGLVLPKWTSTTASNNLCQGNTSMKYLDAPCVTVASNAFNGCSSLDIMVLRRTSAIATLANTNAFTNTPYANGKSGGVIYVPNDLISTYESATNWSTLVGYGTLEFKAIEGSEYETHYADGTEIPT